MICGRPRGAGADGPEAAPSGPVPAHCVRIHVSGRRQSGFTEGRGMLKVDGALALLEAARLPMPVKKQLAAMCLLYGRPVPWACLARCGYFCVSPIGDSVMLLP